MLGAGGQGETGGWKRLGSHSHRAHSLVNRYLVHLGHLPERPDVQQRAQKRRQLRRRGSGSSESTLGSGLTRNEIGRERKVAPGPGSMCKGPEMWGCRTFWSVSRDSVWLVSRVWWDWRGRQWSDNAGALLKGFISILEAVGSHRRDLGRGVSQFVCF